MSLPTFRFLDAGESIGAEDELFWRDVEASDRLASPSCADLYLRELCRTRAVKDAIEAPRGVRLDVRQAELLQAVHARGFRLVGPDVAGAPAMGAPLHRQPA